MSRTIFIKKVVVHWILMSLLIGFTILFLLEHYGKFSYIASSTSQNNKTISFTTYHEYDTEVSSIYFESFFGKTVHTSGNGFTIGDLAFSNSEFKKYENKLYYYTEAFKLDYKYGLIISGGFFLLITFFKTFKIKFK